MKDYFLENGVLIKSNMDDKKHLLWSKGGVPCIDATLWDRYKDQIMKIHFTTRSKRTFDVSKAVFDLNKQVLDFGFGRQYWIEKEFWNI